MTRRGRSAFCLLLAVTIPACRHGPPTPPGTGARETVQSYYEALLHQDWAQAYAALHPDIRSRWNAEEFTRRATAYRRGLDFEPEALRVRSCEEHEKEAIAHVVLTGQSSSKPRSYKDSLVLRWSGGQWGVVLPADFGRAGR